MNTSSIYALRWRTDNPEGFRWCLRGLRNDGTFYGELRLHGANGQCIVGTSVEGQLTPEETRRMIAALDIITCDTPPKAHEAALGVLFLRKSPIDVGDVDRVFEYRGKGDTHSDATQAFLSIVNLIEPHLATYCQMLSEFRRTSS